MKIYGLDDEIVVDTIPSDFTPNHKIFLTTLVHLQIQPLPDKLPKIYTSEILKQQLIIFLKRQGIEVSEYNIHTWKSFEPETVTLSNGIIYEILPLCPSDITTNMGLVIRQDSIIKHIHMGLCSELKSVLTDMTLLSWLIANSVKPDIYIPVSNVGKRCVDCEFRRAIVEIENIVNSENAAEVLVQLPFFGSEAFIAKLSSEFCGYVALCGLLKEFYMILPNAKMENFIDDFNLARIIITGSDTSEFLSSKLQKDNVTHTKKFSLKWSPFPSPTEVNLLMDLVSPKRVYGIPIKNSHAALEQPVQISCIHFNTNESNGQFLLEPIRRHSFNKEKCCLENSQKLNKIVGNVKKIIKQGLRTQELHMASNPKELSNDQSKTLSDSKHREIEAKELPERPCEEDQLSEKCSVYSDEEQAIFYANSKQSQVKITQKKNVSHQSKDMAIVSKAHKSAAPFCSIPPNVLENKDKAKDEDLQTTFFPRNSLVYRKGKKGIGFVDEDSSSLSS